MNNHVHTKLAFINI